MALTFFWRCESSTLDATHDYSAADNIGQGVGSNSYDGAGGIGGGGALTAAAATQGGVGFAANNLITGTVDGSTFPSTLQFAMGCSFKYSGTISGEAFSVPGIFALLGSGTSDVLSIIINADKKLELYARRASGTIRRVLLDYVISADQWYGLVLRYDLPNNYAKVELYTHSGSYSASPTLVASAEPSYTDWADYTPSYITTGAVAVAWYKQAAQDAALYWDNAMLASNYDEALQDNFTIESYTDYGLGGSTDVAAGLGAITVAGQTPITYIPPRRMTLDVLIR